MYITVFHLVHHIQGRVISAIYFTMSDVITRRPLLFRL